MKIVLKTVIFACCLAATQIVAANGRYQIITLSDGGGLGPEKVVILDTIAGHLWTWTESPAGGGSSGGRFLIYQGQVRPGTKMGEIIDKEEWGGSRR